MRVNGLVDTSTKLGGVVASAGEGGTGLWRRRKGGVE